MTTEYERKRKEWENQAVAKVDLGAQVGRTDMSQFMELVGFLREQLDIGATDTVLDVGCGNGYLIEHLAPGNAVSGIDYARTMIDVTKSRLQGDFRVGSGSALPWSAASFDKVLCYSIFHYLENEQMGLAVLAECIRVCKPGGIIFIGDILDNRQESRIKLGSNLDYEKKIEEIHRYSQWLFFDLHVLRDGAIRLGCSARIVEQPKHFRLAHYRADLWMRKLP